MARLRRRSGGVLEDRGIPNLMQIPLEQQLSCKPVMPVSRHTQARTSPRKMAVKSYMSDCGDSEADERQAGVVLHPTLTPKKAGNSRQIRLAPMRNTLTSLSSQPELQLNTNSSVRIDSPRKPRRTPVQAPSQRLLQSDVDDTSDSLPEVDAEESVWCGSGSSSHDSEDELPSPRKLLPTVSRKTEEEVPKALTLDIGNANLSRPLSLLVDNTKSLPTTLPVRSLKNALIPVSRPGSSSDKENQGAFLRFSPPRLYRPTQSPSVERPVTPPQSPSKSRLQSPSKAKARVPTPPHRQSLDAFWDANTVNDWNEQYSPKKILKSPRKLKFLQDEQPQSPTSSPRKTQSPFKKTKAELEARRTFADSKHSIAEDFLAELDTIVTNGQVRELAASTGGVRFVWSKTLNSTAGRANWRRETTKIRHLDGTSTSTHKHHASIELAEKVIDDEDRLLNVIAHEFCHLANFMVSGIKDQPHGRQFKEWGRKCTAAFADRGVKVTTKHSYQIEYKYIWQCSSEDCGIEFKRHSKSIDPKRHTCGSCRSKLVQIKPVPRKNAENGGTSTGYAAYVKANFAAVRKNMPGASQKEVMEAVASKYRAEKQARESPPMEIGIDKPLPIAQVDDVARALEVITIEDD